jgi:hypothetical protein
VTFWPEDLKHHRTRPPTGVPSGYEAYSRDTLRERARSTERNLPAYMSAADDWVLESEGQIVGRSPEHPEGRTYLLPPGRVPFAIVPPI